MSDEAIGRSFALAGFGLTGGLVGTELRAGRTVLGAGPIRTATPGPDLALTAFDGEFATQQLLGTLTTPGGRQIVFHAADRMVNAPRGRLLMTPAEVDQVLEGATRIVKRSDHPQGSTLTIENANMPGRPRVIVDERTGNRIITVINPRVK